jgi:hypothetical protein
MESVAEFEYSEARRRYELICKEIEEEEQQLLEQLDIHLHELQNDLIESNEITQFGKEFLVFLNKFIETKYEESLLDCDFGVIIEQFVEDDFNLSTSNYLKLFDYKEPTIEEVE